jgi:hypothetical protein
MKMNHKTTRYARKVKGKLTTIFDPEQLETLARQSKFIQRSSSKLVGPEFVELMTTELMDEPAVSLEGLCGRLVDLHPQADMTPQALHQRFNAAVTYLQEVLQVALRQQLEPLCDRLPLGALAAFGRVLLEDSTRCRLHERNRSGCQNLALVMPSFHGVPYGHGHAPDHTTTTLEPDSIRSPGLYSDTGGASGKP